MPDDFFGLDRILRPNPSDVGGALKVWVRIFSFILKPRNFLIWTIIVISIGIITTARDAILLPIGIGFILLGLKARQQGR